MRALAVGADQRGMSLLEMLVASTLTALVVGGMLSMLNGMQYTHTDLDVRTSAHQAARLAMDRMHRDLMLTGVGLTPMLPVFPLIAPRDDGGITVRANPAGDVEALRSDMSNNRELAVRSDHGFLIGHRVGIFDSAGNIELRDVTGVRGGRITLDADLARRYRVSDGAAVARIVTTAYFVQPLDGVPTLMRRVDSEPAQPIAQGVLALDITYFDDDQPPSLIVPDTPIRQLRIRMVDIRLLLETAADRVQAGDRPTFELQARISPRALSITRG